jgi:phage terminase small subunit
VANLKLTVKQELFCKEYIIDFNASRSALAAGYSKKTAPSMGAENLIKPQIQAELARLMSERNNTLKIDALWVLKEAVDSYKFNSQEVFDSDNNPKMINATSAAKFLEMCGKHTNVKAFEKEEPKLPQDNHITINIVDAVKPK